jgi:two-component system, OmpR family, response regulator MprA
MALDRSLGAPMRTRVLVVDDDGVTRLVLTRFLGQAGYEVATASTGAAALAAVAARPPAVAIVDWHMPEMNGGDLIRELRARGYRFPCMVMTAAQDARAFAEEVGAEAYVVKPVSLPLLLARLDALVPGNQREPGDTP